MPRVEAIKWYTDADGDWLSVKTADARLLASQTQDGKEYDILIKPHREHRTLTQNAYYWQLVNKIASAIHNTTNFVHNTMLRRYGQVESIDGKIIYLVLPDTEEAMQKADNADTYHIKPTSQVKEGKDGQNYRTYIMLRGSSSYNTAEFSQLVTGTVEEAKQLGIETLTREELALLG